MRMQTIKFKTATVTIEGKHLKATFRDGKENNFYFDNWIHDNLEYQQIARDMGYDDVERYAVDHELMHHFIADQLGWNHSFAVYENTWYDEPWPAHIAWEEHIVNKMQRYVKTREPDEYGVLQKIFRERLGGVGYRFHLLSLSVEAGDDVDFRRSPS